MLASGDDSTQADTFIGVVITDFRESQDIMTRRTREFDRSAFFGDLLYALGPSNQVHMPTGDVWRAHRRLMGDTM